MVCGLRFVYGKVREKEFEAICGSYDHDADILFICDKCRSKLKNKDTLGGLDE